MEPTLVSGVFHAITLIILCALSLILQHQPPLYNQQFFEQDLSLSYTNYNSRVSSDANIVFSTVIPAIVIVLLCTIPQYNVIRHIKQNNTSLKVCLIVHFALYLGYTLLVTSIITNIIKCVASSPRPNFFDYCNYQHFSTNNTLYLNLTSYGKEGNYSLCFASYEDINDSRKSFPSGHASLSFAAMLYISLLFDFYFDNKKILNFGDDVEFIKRKKYINDFEMLKLLCYLPLMVCTWISITRIQDNKHRIQDITVGALIGSIVCYLIFTKLTEKLYGELSKRFLEHEVLINYYASSR